MSIFSDSKDSDNKLAHVVVLLVTACALLGPTFLLSIVMAQFWPLYLMAGTQALGGMIGVVRYHQTSNGFSGDDLTRALNASSNVTQFPKHRLIRAH